MSDQRFGGASALKAVLWTTGSTYVSYFLGLAVSIAIARTLGAAEFGRYAYIVWLSGVLILIANHGLTITGIKFVSESIGRGSHPLASYVHGWLARIQHISIVVVAATYAIFSPWLQPSGSSGYSYGISLAILISFSFKAQSLFNTSIAKGFGHFSIEPITNVSVTLFSAAAVVGLTIFHPSVIGYATIFALSSIGYAWLSHFQIRRAGLRPQHNDHHSTPGLLERMRPHLLYTAALAAIGAIGSRSIEMFLLNRLVGAAEVGYFAISTAMTRAGIELLVAGLSSVMMPIMGYVVGSGDRDKAQEFFSNACRYYQFFGLLIAGIGVFWADVVVLLMYGPQYTDVAPVFRIMIVTSGVLLTSGAFSAVLANSDNQRFRVGVTIISFIVTFACAIALIPLYGVLGAAFAQAIASVICVGIVVVGIQRFAHLRTPWRALLRQFLFATVVSAVSASIILVTDSPIAQWGAGLVFALAFVGLSIPAGIWRNEERLFLASLMLRQPRLKWIARLISPTHIGSEN